MSAYDDPNSFDYIFIAVHGTFSTSTKWALEGSKLDETLRTTFADKRWRIEHFQWRSSGFFRRFNNSHAARSAAAERFRQHLITLTVKAPRSQIFVFAHSHGGNAVLLALQQQPGIPQVRGIVLLATPLLLVHRPQEYFFQNLPSISRLFGILWFGVCLYVLWEGPRWFAEVPTRAGLIAWVALLGWPIGWLVGKGACETIVGDYRDWLKGKLDSFSRAANTIWPTYPCFCAEVEQDEAIIALRILSVIRRVQGFSTVLRLRSLVRMFSDSRQPEGWYRKFERRYEDEDGAGFWASSLSLSVRLSLVVALTFFSLFIYGKEPPPPQVLLYGVIVSVAPLALVLSLYVAAWLLVIVMAVMHVLWTGIFATFYGVVNPFLFGWSHVVLSFFSSVHASGTDKNTPGNVTLKRYKISRSALSLGHSKVCSYEPVLRDIVNWISNL
jgi:hypothetical protein